MYARQRYGRFGAGVARSFSGRGCCDGGNTPDDCCGGRALTFNSGLFGDETPESLRDKLTSEPVSTVSAVALTYHGYKRTGSLLWAVIYGFAGKTIPLVAVPVALAQGFGKSKPGCP